MNLPVIKLIRHVKFSDGTKPGYGSDLTLPTGDKIVTMDPGLVLSGQYECNWELSPHLTQIMFDRTGIDTPVYAYRLKDAKIKDGSISQNILFHGGNWIEDSMGCFLTGMRFSTAFDYKTNKNETDLVAPLTAKALMAQKLSPAGTNNPAPFSLDLQNLPGIVI